ncbi:hypothetical protein L210DRAFT_635691 [Boletus edulis BED1]|uniref:Zn(2)-C6 fungal-type domain-containing protein n=1 Tax=Boletus edulis BED1 TaxID=1328754 RepID=A0AAD4GFZ8_BOLED|nr:hypothetical protein L210DRAFT_635691 [Boletus edulis BED1]
MRDQTDSDEDQGGSSWRTHGSAESLRSLERRRSTDEGSHRPYGIPLLTRAFEWPSPERDEPPPGFQPRFSSGVEPPLTPTIDPPGGTVSAVSHHEYSDSRLLRPLHYPDLQYGRHRSAPLYGSEDWNRRISFGRLPLPGSQPEGSSSRVVLPPVSHLLGELGMLSPDDYERGPVLPQLRLPEEPAVGPAPRMDEEGSMDTRSMQQQRGKRGLVEMGAGEEKRVARKIYVACDFCRGRKLRCDGGRPRCSNCETRSLVCQYQEHPRRRGPGKAPKGSRGKKAGRKSAGDPDMAGPSGVP